MNVVAVKTISSSHNEHTFRHKVKGKKKTIKVVVSELTPEKASKRAWDDEVKKMYRELKEK